MKSTFHYWLYPLFVLAVGLAAAAPLWLVPGLPNSDDSLTHVFNLFALDQQVQAGDWFPLRFPERGLGYGYAVLAYYPPLPYALLELIHLAGADYVLSFKLGLTLMTVLAGFTSFALGRQFFNRPAALAITILYLWNPYLQANLHLRGALAEQLGLALGPLLFLTSGRLIAQPGWRAYLLTSLSAALLVLAHFLSALLYLPFALLYALWTIWHIPPANRGSSARWLVLAGGTGALLSAFYWAPALVERGGLRYFDPGAAQAAYLAELLPVADLLRPSLVNTYSNTHQMPEVGLPLLLILALTLLLAWGNWPTSARAGWRQARFWGTVGAVALGGVTELAVPLWHWLPALAISQFPFRWLGPIALCCALAGGNLVCALAQWRAGLRWIGVGAVGLLLLWYGYAAVRNLPLQPAQLRSAGVAQVTAADITLAGLYAYEYDQADNWRQECWFWAYEYIPATSSLSNCVAMRDLILQSAPLASDLPAVAAQIQPQWLTVNELAAHSIATQPWVATLHAFWIPGWQAWLDGQPVPTQPVGPIGLVGLAVPAGEHDLKISYRLTPLRRLLLQLAVLLWLLWLLVALRCYPALAAMLLLGFVLLTGLLYVRAPPLTPPPTLQPVNYHFDPLLALQGYGVAVEDRQLRLDLVWLARQSMAESYKIFVHVIDDTGKLWAQDDSRPLRFASNTNRWLPGQVLLDSHYLTLPANLPAGEYQVRVGLYAESNGQRLPVLNEQGAAADDQVLLQRVAIEEIGK